MASSGDRRGKEPARLIALLAAAVLASGVLSLLAAPSLARPAQTTAALNLRAGPGTQYRVITTMPAGARVDLGKCGEGWCAVAWRGRNGFASRRGLAGTAGFPAIRAAPVPQAIVIDPPYPYQAGHYRSANLYEELPPYAAVPPRYYPRRFMLSPRERHRYRYRPHIFGSAGDAGRYAK